MMLLKTLAAAALLVAALQDEAEKRIPGFRLKTAQGDEVSFGFEDGVAAVSTRGGTSKPKAILLHFFQPDCNACHEEMKALETLHADLASKGAFVAGIAHRGDEAAVKPLLDKLKITLPALLGRGSELAKAHSRGDATVIADATGIVRYSQVGFKAEDAKVFRESIEQLLADRKVTARSNERRRLNVGEKFPDVKLPSLMTGKPASLTIEDGKLTFRDESGKASHPKGAVGFFSRY